jgi:hypothetical protein
MLKRLFVLAIVIGLMFSLVTVAAAQSSYSFSLDKEIVSAYWNADGTLAVDYHFTFTNDPGAHIIDFVDVGMPNGNFDRSSISADVQGKTVSISSDYQGQGGYGFSVDMGAHAIQPGQQGSVHVYVGRISQVLYADSNDPTTYASGDFSPTWFGSQDVHGNTDLTVIFYLPPGVQPDEPRYHDISNWPGDKTPQTGLDNQGRVTYTWQSAAASGSTQYVFGASFPQKYIPAETIVTAPAFDIGGAIASAFSCLGSLSCPGLFFLIIIGSIIASAVSQSRRKLAYLPPKIQIEGHGIKRGLTAVEAAILMEQPLDKVLTMILFEVIKKGAAQVISREPLQIKTMKTQAAAPLYDYETGFLQAFNLPDAKARKISLQGMMVALVNSVSAKMKGFSRKETLDYYQSIMERAWQQIAAAGTPEVQSQMFDEAVEWTMLDKNYDDRTRRVFTGPVFVPTWWGNYDPGYRPVSSAPAAAGMPTTGGRAALPGANVAASMVSGAQNFAGQVVGNVSEFTSNITNRTNPVPVTRSSGYSGGGGGHCACACACAGCACACAGGGR